MSKLSDPIPLPEVEAGVYAILAYSLGQDTVYLKGAGRKEVVLVGVGFGGDRVIGTVKTDGEMSALCPRPGFSSDAFSSYLPRDLSCVEYDVLRSNNILPSAQVSIPAELNVLQIPWVVWDGDNAEVYCCSSSLLGSPDGFFGLIVLDANTKQYKRKIDLSAEDFQMYLTDMSAKPSVSRLRKIFCANGLQDTVLDSAEVMCINDQDDVVIEKIKMPYINGRRVDYVSGTIVDNVRDILYAVCVADGPDWDVAAIVHAFDIKNNFELIGSSPVVDRGLYFPVLNLEKRIMYLSAVPSQGAGDISCSLVSLGLEKMIFLNSVFFPESQIQSIVHLARSDRVGVATSKLVLIGADPTFYIVSQPEVP